jgi:hypothetical protein
LPFVRAIKRNQIRLTLLNLFEEGQRLVGGVGNYSLPMADPCSPLREYSRFGVTGVIALSYD